jgi:peptide deformylase
MNKERKIPEIVQYDTPLGEKVLRAVSKEISVEKISKEENQNLITDLKSALGTQADGVGISAPQIGINKRIFVINPAVYHSLQDTLPENTPIKTVFINPEITWTSGDKKSMDEGCLSVRPWYGKVKRATRARIKAYDENGQEFEIEGRGLLSQAFQHEVDHLNGVLFIDKAKDLRKMEAAGE